ncbi:MAG: FmdE family protein [Methanosarcinaceae archaeon]
MDEIIRQIRDPELLLQIEKVVPFHGFLSTGAFIGIQMFNIAKKVLDLQDGERIFATCETYNCLPDPFQVLGGATIGNKGLKIADSGKMAVIVNKRAPAGVTSVRGIRIYLDPDRTKKYPELHAWYLNTGKVSHKEAIHDLIKAGEDAYTYEMVNVEVPIKLTKCIEMCEKCGESFVRYGEEVLCSTCTA